MWNIGMDAARAHRSPAWRGHGVLVWPWIGALLATFWLMPGQGDLWLADHLFAWQGGQWRWRDAWWAQSVMHVGGKHLSLAAWVAVVIAWRCAGRVSWIPAGWRHALAYLALAVPLATCAVTLGKHLTGMDCPWSLLRYGGQWPLVPLWQARPSVWPDAACFPAGHASAGYAWVALYWALVGAPRRWRRAGLGLGLAAGMAFGLVQQLRGAHFLSHDLWALVFCWTVATVLAFFMLPDTRPSAGGELR